VKNDIKKQKINKVKKGIKNENKNNNQHENKKNEITKIKNKEQKTKSKKQKTNKEKQKQSIHNIPHLFLLYDKKSFSAHMPCKQHIELERFLNKEVTNLSLEPSRED
jgi:hypothetical protein